MEKNKQQKYLVLLPSQLEDLIKVANKSPQKVVVMDLEAAGKNYPGQLRYTDTFRRRTNAISRGFDSWEEYCKASVDEVIKRQKEIEGAELEKEIVNRGPAWR